ncbi:hypothetical protein ANN_04902 [Periplaneta americana]|uniref:Uncharacterized protein n=1 Tax=Periplaneta americana TaxID=6978 RepID=A0ABQ8T9N4_PERAM|nr:hypothetical protein ANN_04902 [Periplaneta americana]
MFLIMSECNLDDYNNYWYDLDIYDREYDLDVYGCEYDLDATSYKRDSLLTRLYVYDCEYDSDHYDCEYNLDVYGYNNVHRLSWPAQRPGLNPIEHLWDKLGQRLKSLEMRPTSIVQLRAMLQEEWRRIPVDILHKLVESMPDRVAAVTATRGHCALKKNLYTYRMGHSINPTCARCSEGDESVAAMHSLIKELSSLGNISQSLMSYQLSQSVV